MQKIGDKYLIRKKRKENNPKKENRKLESVKTTLKDIEIHINSLFKYKYTKMCEYNMIIINRLIFTINSEVVAVFKENLINNDENEFFFRFYEKRKSIESLKKYLKYYEANNIIYPNYISLYEGNYIFNNIEQKQKIIDREENKDKNKNKKEEVDLNKEEKIFNSNILDSILNQTNNSENKKIFGIKDDNNFINDDLKQINSLIKNIDNFEKKGNKKIFKNKSLIRIVNDSNKVAIKENSIKKDDNKRIYVKELLSTISYFQKDKKIKEKDSSPKENVNNKEYNKEYYTNNQYNLTIYKNNIYKYIKNHKRINTFDTNQIRTKKLVSPYVIKRPINVDNTTYLKKKIYQNYAGRNNSNLHKNSKSINIKNSSNLYLDSDYFNLDNNYKEIKVYKKKVNTKDTNYNNENKLNNYNQTAINQKNDNTQENRNKIKVNFQQLNIPMRTYVSTNNNERNNLNNNKFKDNALSPNLNFKTMTKFMKAKYLIDEGLKSKLNSTPLTERNTLNNFKYKTIKNNLYKRNDNNKNNETKNIYISNNITNNNFYTINDGNKKKMKILIYRNDIKNEVSTRNKDWSNKKEHKLDKFGNLYINTENRNPKKYQYKKLNNQIINKVISFSRNNYRKNIINTYKNGLINSTTLKSLDKNSLNSLLNTFRSENSSITKSISLANNNLKYQTINEMKYKKNKMF